MAINLLPIVLIGGTAAVVISRKKKKDESEKKKCPPTTVITMGEMGTVSKRAVAQHGTKADPSDEVNFFVNEILPPGCNRASMHSKVKIQFKGSKNDFELTIPDVYMLTFGQSLSTRVDSGALSQQEAEKFWSRELDWYKKVTGTNFDPKLANLETLAMAILESLQGAMEELLGGKKGRSPGKLPPPTGTCPQMFDLTIDPAMTQMMSALVQSSISIGIADPFKIADTMMDQIIPAGCSKRDYQSTVRIMIVHPDNPEPLSFTVNLAEYYGLTVWNVAQELLENNKIGPPQLAQIQSKIQSNYQRLTGEPFPSQLN